MHSSHLIQSILQSKWAIDPGYAFTQGPVIANLLNHHIDFERQEPDKMTAFAVAPSAGVRTAKYSYWDGFDRAPAGSVAIVRLKGVLLKDDQYCGPAGTATIGEVIKAAGEHENIAAIVLHIDSPGGTVDGTEALGNIVKAVEKPVVTFVDGLMASAAFWVGSYADEIFASTDTDEIGSVGVMLSFMDVQPYWESLGIVFRTMKASTSPDKNQIWEDIRQGKKEAVDLFIKEVLDPLDEKFMGIIRENLPEIEDQHLTGKVFFARDIMNIVVDRIGTLDDAVNRAAELANQKKGNTGGGASATEKKTVIEEETVAATLEQTEEQTSVEDEHNLLTNKNTMKQYKNVNAALGVETLEAVDEVVSLNDDQLEALDTALGANNPEELQTQLDAANNTIGTLNTTVSGHVETIAARDASIVEKDAEIARLKGKAEDTTTAKPAGDDTDLNKGKTKTVVSDEDDFETAVQKVNNEYLAKH